MTRLCDDAKTALSDLFHFGSCGNMGTMPKQGWKRSWSLADIFRNFTERRGACLIWTGSLTRNGYGRIAHRGPSRLAHRVAYERAHGDIPTGMYVCHSCDRPSCVEPRHLWLGTAADNTHDAVRKGRMASGSRHGTRTRPDLIPRGENRAFAKLTKQNVRAIKKLLMAGVLQKPIAEWYDVSQTTISKIATRKKWKHVV